MKQKHFQEQVVEHALLGIADAVDHPDWLDAPHDLGIDHPLRCS
jgi:hypothetical protein